MNVWRAIYIIITKNIHYLLWNRGVWRFFHDSYLTIEVQGIRCTNHLHDFCPLTDVNPHFTTPGCRYYFKINSWWPSYCDVIDIWMGQPLAIVTSPWPIVPTGIYGCMMLRTPVCQHGASLVYIIKLKQTHLHISWIMLYMINISSVETIYGEDLNISPLIELWYVKFMLL